MNIQYIETKGKRTFAVLPIDDFERLIAAAEYAGDLRDIDASAGDETFPHALVERLIGSEHPLLVWREYRGMTQQALHNASGISQGFITQIESGKKTGSVKTLKALAQALQCDLDALTRDI